MSDEARRCVAVISLDAAYDLAKAALDDFAWAAADRLSEVEAQRDEAVALLERADVTQQVSGDWIKALRALLERLQGTQEPRS